MKKRALLFFSVLCCSCLLMAATTVETGSKPSGIPKKPEPVEIETTISLASATTLAGVGACYVSCSHSPDVECSSGGGRSCEGFPGVGCIEYNDSGEPVVFNPCYEVIG